MAVIKSGATTDQLTVDPISKAARVTTYSSAGVELSPASATATGSPVPANAVFVAGTDGTNLRGLLTSATGQVHTIVDSGSTTVSGVVTVQGDSASGAANAGNPVKIGGVFNTTQPTVTNGQTVDQQSTARGALIVATGVDTFNVTVATALPAGSNVIGHVITDTGSTTTVTGTVTVSGTVSATQGTSPWVENLTQVASTVLGTPQTFGTAPSGVVIGTSSDVYVAGTRARSNQSTTAAGVQDINVVGVLGATLSATNGLFSNILQTNAVLSVTNPIFSSISDGTTKVSVIAATNALKTDLSSVAGTATSTAAAGVQKVGIVGNTGAAVDSVNTAATAPANALLTSLMYNSTVPVLTNGQAVAAEGDTAGSLYVDVEGRKNTFRVGVVGFTPIASATAPAISVTGSATKTIRITRIRLTATASTGAVSNISLLRFSALSGGTPNSQAANVAKMDSGNATQTAVVNQWSAAATTATGAGIVNAERYEIVTAAVSVQQGAIEWTFGDKNGQGLVLRGTSEFAGFLFSAVGTTPVADCWIEWTEE